MSSNPTKSEATNAETTKNPKEGSDWLGGPQNGSETPGKSTEGAYQQNGQSWLGGPQNGSEIPGKSDYTKHRFNETPGNGGNGGNGGNASGSGNGGNGAVTQNGNVESDYTKHR